MFYSLLMEEGAEATRGGDWTLLLILGVFIIGMLAFSIIPQRRKQKQMAEMNSRIKVGDKIKTIGGIFGTIVDYDEENNLFTILSGSTTFEIDRSCVYSMEMAGAKAAAEAPAEVKEEKPTEEQNEAFENISQNKEEVIEEQPKDNGKKE